MDSLQLKYGFVMEDGVVSVSAALQASNCLFKKVSDVAGLLVWFWFRLFRASTARISWADVLDSADREPFHTNFRRRVTVISPSLTLRHHVLMIGVVAVGTHIFSALVKLVYVGGMDKQ